MAQWIIVAIVIAGFIFNSGILYNDMTHLKKDMKDVKEEQTKTREILTKLILSAMAKGDSKEIERLENELFSFDK